jgi:hypothetical protein
MVNSKQIVSVYHTTKLGNAERILKVGWFVPRQIHIGQVYGRGIYFWELLEDAHEYGKRMYGVNNYEIIEEHLPLIEGKYLYYDHKKRVYSDHDDISKGLLKRGICCLVIVRSYMDRSTMEAKGRAFVWLVNIDEDFVVVDF